MKPDRQGLRPCFFLLATSLVFGLHEARAAGVWEEVQAPTLSLMNGVAFLDRANAWAVGDNGTVLRYAYSSSSSWGIFPSSTDKNLYAVTAVSNGEAWAVGEMGTIVHFNGSTWSQHPDSGTITLLDLRAVAFINPNNGWAVGGAPGQGGVILHYDGASWTTRSMTASPLYGLAVVSSEYAWFCGEDRTLILFDGTNFITDPPLLGGVGIWRAIVFPYQRLGWVVGDGGTVARFTATGGWVLNPASGVATTENLYGLRVLPDPEQGYAVGAAGVRLRVTDPVVSLEASGGTDLRGIGMPNPAEGGAVGGVGVPRISMFRAYTDAADLSGVRVYPNPYDPGSGRPFSFDRLPANVSGISIYTIEGDIIADLGSGIAYRYKIGTAVWTGLTRLGRKPATGTYVFRITAPGKTRTGLILVVRK